ncbi:MAG: ATP-binding protein, partial [Burkholderiaceae bacterium]|nr:ATP-binding protein [Burkholderiaceae bacterium]
DAADPLTAGQRERVARIREAAENLLALVGDATDFARLEAGTAGVNVEVVALEPLLQEALAEAAGPAAAAGVAVPAAADVRAEPHVWADRGRLRQVLAKLLANAIQFNRAGGQVTLDVRRQPQARVQIAIADNGAGMSAEQVARLLQPFQPGGLPTVEPRGSGLALPIAVRLIEQMGGTLKIDSEPGRGTTVTISLREAHVVPAAPAGAGTSAALMPREDVAGVVLYVEDDAANRLFVEQLLHLRPRVRLYKAPDGATGLLLAEASRPDLILIDMRLPDMDGLELLRRLRAQPATAAVPCVAVSAHTLPEDIERARACGFLHYWTKPLDASAFLAGVDALLPCTPR